MAEEKPKQEAKKEETKDEEKKEDNKVETKEEKKPVKKVEIKKKELAIVSGKSLRLSFKHCVAICKMIQGMTPERAVGFLDGVSKGKIPVHMKSAEVPHQKGKGVSGAKYPKKASLELIGLVKQLAANANVNQIEEPIIFIAKADKASRPFRRAGRQAKRCHVYLEAKTKLKKEKK